MASEPKVFISYCWSSVDREHWVIKLATELVNSGVDVVLDKWDLREGHDAIAFMESMVTDATINKVIIICDKQYAQKADQRAGGVGTEAQIISAEVYRRQKQDKFVAVIAERNEDGSAPTPTYYASRIYIDLSSPGNYAENFESLVRFVFDKPLHKKPTLGKPPSYVSEVELAGLPTSTLANRAVDALKTGKSISLGAVDEYLELFASSLENFRLPMDTRDDEPIINSVDQFLPYRDEFLGVLSNMIRYARANDYSERIHSFLEQLLPYMNRPTEVSSWSRIAFDNYRFIVHELFLHTLSMIIHSGNIEAADYLLGNPYIANDDGSGGRKATNFGAFRMPAESFDLRNRRLDLKRISIRADLLEQRARNTRNQFVQVMETDFVCFLRYEIIKGNTMKIWWPETLLYTFKQYGPFDLFLRASSKKAMPTLLKLLGASNIQTLKDVVDDFRSQKRQLPRWNYETLPVEGLMNLDALGSSS